MINIEIAKSNSLNIKDAKKEWRMHAFKSHALSVTINFWVDATDNGSSHARMIFSTPNVNRLLMVLNYQNHQGKILCYFCRDFKSRNLSFRGICIFDISCDSCIE